MAVALETFVKNLEDSGIISPSKLKVFLPPQAAPKDAQELARQLIQQKQLTKFQAQEIYQGRTKSLILGNYTILDKIGAGGMGQVFKAEHRRMHRIVAIKTLPTKMMKDPAAVARFEREVHAAAKLSHANIVAAHDADEANGVYFLVMEYVEGADLSALVKKNGPFPVAKACNYILQAARGLEFAHKKGVVHRDIKPANLLLDNEGTVKILDMGLARIDAGDGAAQAELTGTGMVMGTVDYMAPEQATSTHDADARADIYSLGCSLHYLIVGKATYGGETVIEKLLAHRDKPIPVLREFRPEVSDDLQAIFEKMVAKTVEDRYQTMTDVIADLERFCAGQSTSFSGPKIVTAADTGTVTFLKETPRATAKKTKPAILQGKNRTILISGVAAAVVLLLGIVGGWMLLGGKPDPKPDGRLAKNERPPPPPVKPTGKPSPKPPPAKQPFGPTPTTPAPAAPDDFALEFDGRQSHVILPWSYDNSHPLTVEATIWPLEPLEDTPFAGRLGSILSNTERAGIGLSISDKRGVQAELAYKKGESPSYLIVDDENTTLSGQKSRIAAVFNGRQLQLIRDGLVVKSAVAEGEPLPSKMQTILGGNPMADNKTIHLFFRGRIDEVRISKIARKEQLLTKTPKLTADAETIALYHFDEGTGDVLKDSSGKNQHGKIVGAKWVRADAPISVQVPSHALAFDGKTMVSVPNIAWGPLQEFTFEAFARPDDSLGDGFIVDRYKNANLARYQGRWQLTVKYAVAEAPAYAGQKTASSQVGTWYHLAGVVHNNTARFFVDGKLIEATPLINPLEPGLGDKLEFGKKFTGAIRGIRISNVARYNAEFAPPQKLSADPQTLALYDFADGAGNLLTDASGHRLHGQIDGAKWISLDDFDRKAAEWVLSWPNNSLVRVELVNEPGKTVDVSNATQLPPGPFRNVSITIGPKTNGAHSVSKVNGLLYLKRLDVSQSATTDAEMTQLKNLPQLSQLKLNTTAFSDKTVQHLAAEFRSLTELDLRLNPGITDESLKYAEKMPALTSLRLQGTKVTAAGIAALQKILPNCKIESDFSAPPTAPQPMAAADRDRTAAEWVVSKGRKVLLLQNGKPSPWINSATALPPALFQLQKVDLSRLSTQTNTLVAIRNEDLVNLSTLTNLESLNLNAAGNISDAGLVHLSSLKSLKELRLESCRDVTDAGMVHLAGLSEIRLLVLNHTKVTGAGLSHLQGLKKLEWLDIYHVTDDSVPTLLNFPQLTTLRCQQSPLTDNGVAKLTALQKLNSLGLDDSKITDDGLKAVLQLPELTELTLRFTGITDQGLMQLLKLSKLSRLVVTHSKVTPAGMADLKKLLPKCRIEWEENIKPAPPTNLVPPATVPPAQAAAPQAWTPRTMAEWTIGRGGKVWIGKQTDIAKVEDLPAEVTYLTLVSMEGVRDLDDKDLTTIISWSERYDLSFGLMFNNTPLTDEGLRRLAAVKARGSVSFLLTRITGTGFDAWLGKPVGTLAVERCAISPTGWQNIARLGNLNQLFANRTSLGNAELRDIISQHPELNLIDADVTQLSDAAIDDLQALKNLTYLNLGSTFVTDNAVPKLAQMSSLQTLKLQKTKVTAAGIDTLKKALPNCKVE